MEGYAHRGRRATICRPSLESGAPGMFVHVSAQGLAYAEDVLLTRVLRDVTPLDLPDVRKTLAVPFLGSVDFTLNEITLVKAEVPSSTISLLGPSGIEILCSGAHASLSLHWMYKYGSLWLPTRISHMGRANVKVLGMRIEITVNMVERGGRLGFDLNGCVIQFESLEVNFQGGASWLYQWVVDTFGDRIRAALVRSLKDQIEKGLMELDSFLMELPRKVSIDNISDLDLTILQAEILSSSCLSIGLRATFVSHQASLVNTNGGLVAPPGLITIDPLRMLTIVINESILKSAAAVYCTGTMLNNMVDGLPVKDYLNTEKWKYLIPQLYIQYPNAEMKLTFLVSSSPSVKITPGGVQVSASTYMTIAVLTRNQTIPLACICITVNLSGMANIKGNNVIGETKIDNLHLNLEWTNIGKFRLQLVKFIVRSLLKDTVLPDLNGKLRKGFPLPLLPTIKLKNAGVHFKAGYILIFSDVQYSRTSSI